MKKGISLHLGLNRIDPGHYGDDGWLKNPENDAIAMQELAHERGFETTLLLTENATSERLKEELLSASKGLSSGDFFLITYAGHGSHVPDKNNEEEDGRDET